MVGNKLRTDQMTPVERNRLHGKVDQAAMRELRHRHEEEFQHIRHTVQHELGEPHVHEAADHEHLDPDSR